MNSRNHEGEYLMVPKKLIEAINAASWRASELEGPHEYIVDKWNPELFHEITSLIRLEGYRGTFNNEEYRYLDIGEHRYWQIDIILNRASNDQPSKGFRRIE
jgi:hypothetical protein